MPDWLRWVILFPVAYVFSCLFGMCAFYGLSGFGVAAQVNAMWLGAFVGFVASATFVAPSNKIIVAFLSADFFLILLAILHNAI